MSARRRCAVPTCRHSPSAHEDSQGCLLCGCGAWLDRQPHQWRDDVQTAWFFATVAWAKAAEEASNGWQTELGEFEERHPRPRLADFMRALSPGSPEDDLDALVEPIKPCPACGGTGHAS